MFFVIKTVSAKTYENTELDQYSDQDFSEMSAQDATDNIDYIIQNRKFSTLNSDAQSAVLQKNWGLTSVNLVGQQAQLNGDTLTVSGTTINLAEMSGRTITVSGNDVFVDGQKFTNANNIGSKDGGITADTVQAFDNNNPSTPISFTNARNINFQQGQLSIESAESLIYYGSRSNNIYLFSGKTTTFSVARADKINIENTDFNFIKQATFTITGSKLISANLTCEKNNTITTLRNLIPSSSMYFNIYCNEDEKYALNYRKDENKTEFFSDKGTFLDFFGTANITFNATGPNSYFAIIKDTPPRYLAKNGILIFNSNAFTEQLEGNCNISYAYINFISGFSKTLLMPRFSLLCRGARYSYISNIEREMSYSIYNIGESPYIIGFEKGILFDTFKSSINDNNYGFVLKNSGNMTLNGFIEYDRIPEKALFPGINEAEYRAFAIIWHPVYSSLDQGTKTEIQSNSKINILSESSARENKTIVEINSGIFSIKEEITNGSLRRYANFNKETISPDYVEMYKFNNEPTVWIQNKTLNQYGQSREGNEKFVRMFTPDTKASNDFWDWFKIKTVIKNLAEFIGGTR